MSTEPKMTPWFDKGQRPARPGTYEVQHKTTPFEGGPWFARWDGDAWYWACDSLEAASTYSLKVSQLDALNGPAYSSGLGKNHFHHKGKWRGLAEKP